MINSIEEAQATTVELASFLFRCSDAVKKLSASHAEVTAERDLIRKELEKQKEWPDCGSPKREITTSPKQE